MALKHVMVTGDRQADNLRSGAPDSLALKYHGSEGSEVSLDWVQNLRSFVSAVQQGSLSGAGRQLGRSPASISRHITLLEDEVGVQLLKRSSRSLALTEAGELYFKHVEQILLQLNEANASISQLNTEPRGTLKVHSRMLVGELLIIPHISEFLSGYPNITIDLALSNNVVSVDEHEADIDIRIGRLENSSLIARKLCSSERVICATPDYLSSNPSISKPEDLRGHNCLTYRINHGIPVWRFRDDLQQITEVPIKGNFQTEFGCALVELVKQGAGIALLPDWSIHRDLKNGNLVRLFPEFQVSHTNFENGVFAVFPKARLTSLRHRLFINFLVVVFNRELK